MSIPLANRYGSRGGLLAWDLLVVGSFAGLGADVSIAELSLIGRIIAAWPWFDECGGAHGRGDSPCRP
ncbi:hypothetical protein [Sphaerimonospora mesophila]|uniref:hypothetical protein n=1 Tax=Sphaerimonospora mesophila TaxID=37483 RepID=UPI001F43070A